MNIEDLDIKGGYLFTPSLHSDERGFFYRIFGDEELKQAGILIDPIVQVNRSFNKKAGTFRGFHFQHPPYMEEKLVTCLNGSVMDIIVDLREGSNTFLNHKIIQLSQENNAIVLIPKGCAHGFITIEENSELLYLHTNYYRPGSEGGLSLWDPRLNIKLPGNIVEISDGDKSQPFLNADFKGLKV